MNKNYILRFDKILGDYVIIESCNQKVENQNKNNLTKKGLFFIKNPFKNAKNNINFVKNESNIENSNNLSTGYLVGLENEIHKKINDRERLSVELHNLESKILENQQENILPESSPAINQPSDILKPDNDSQNNIKNGATIDEGVMLLSQLYGNFRILNQIYQNLRDINQNNSQIFKNMISDNISLIGGLLNVYYEVSGNNTPPILDDSVPLLSSEYDEIVQLASARVQGMRDVNMRLLKLFNVENFNRQFNLIESSLAIQFGNLSDIRLNVLCCKIKGM